MTTLDQMATILHEFLEMEDMAQRGLSYDEAHDLATARESVFRDKFVGVKTFSLATVRQELKAFQR
jgi:hypothetical protein